MPTIDELMSSKGQLAATLAAGVESISSDQEITFTKYVKVILPLDGFVFWVRSDLLGAAELKNITQIGPNPVSSQATFCATGSLHFATERRQLEDETIGVNKVRFTATAEVQPFNEISPVIMFVGSFNGVRFAFAQRRSYYKQADLHHYMGDAIYPALLSQIIDSVADLNITQRVVSNSLPVWLSLNKLFPVFPSFLVPDNLPPPYAVAHVIPDSLRAIQAYPQYDLMNTATQLMAERVKITLYGIRNDLANDFLKEVYRFAEFTNAIGVMNQPAVRDEKRTQVELAAIAMKKAVDFEISYYQTRVNDIAQQMISRVIPSITTPLTASRS
jgi:hypothetical protein